MPVRLSSSVAMLQKRFPKYLGGSGQEQINLEHNLRMFQVLFLETIRLLVNFMKISQLDVISQISAQKQSLILKKSSKAKYYCLAYLRFFGIY